MTAELHPHIVRRPGWNLNDVVDPNSYRGTILVWPTDDADRLARLDEADGPHDTAEDEAEISRFMRLLGGAE